MKKGLNKTTEEIKLAIQTSNSIAQALRNLSLKPAGGNYRTIKRYIKNNDIDINHFTGQAHNHGKRYIMRSTSEYLNNSIPVSSNTLRIRLIKEGYFEHKCYRCELMEWQGNKIPVELEHIDGNHDNNELSNLTLLCPNCHALTLTYRGRKRKQKPTLCECGNEMQKTSKKCFQCARKYKLESNWFDEKDPKKIYQRFKQKHLNVCECNAIIDYRATFCKDCVKRKRYKITWPNNQTLTEMVLLSNPNKVAKQLGVSRTTIRRHLAKMVPRARLELALNES